MKKTQDFILNLFRLEGLIVLYFLTLLFFGRAFTKFQVAGPLYLHDAVFLLLTIVALNRGKIKYRFRSILLLLAIALAYLILSLLFFHLNGQLIVMAFRQFYIFVYLGCAWVLFNTCVNSSEDLYKPLQLIRYISILSVWLQVALILFGFLFVRGFSLFGEGDYNYFSPLAVFGIISYSAMILAYETKPWRKYIRYLLVLLLSTTLGHSSAFLAVFMVLLIYFFVRITPFQRFIALGIIVGAVLVLKALPEFRDVNASWRLLYWQHVMDNVVRQHYLVLGNGFGRPYMTYDYAVYLNRTLNSPNMIDEFYPMARYLVPPHNSLLTIFFHVGLLPGLLVFIPLNGYARQLLLRAGSSKPSDNFVLYALVGCLIWVCFNVILELPHSATYFWLVFFTAAYTFRTNHRFDNKNNS
jgi:hypothetical protein